MTQRCVVVSCFAGWHGFDLAQGLDRAGLLECLVTLASPRQIESRYGISRHRIRRLPLSPLLHRLELTLTKYAARFLKEAFFHAFCWLYDGFTRLSLTSQTKMLVAWHPFATRSLLAASRRGIVTAIDVGSTHPAEQFSVLSAEFAALGLPKPWVPHRVLAQSWIFSLVDLIVVPSTAVRKSFLKHGISDAKLLVNPYGIDPSLFNPPNELTGNGPFTNDSPLRVIVVAGLTPRKGSRLLLEICRHFETDQRISFTLVGTLDPPYCFHTSELPGNLALHAPMPHEALVQLYHQHHVCLLPSIEEGFARVLIEAAACGLTLLATQSTGLSDLLLHSPKSGYLLRDHDLPTAIKTLNDLIDGSLPLNSLDPDALSFFARDSYQQRAVQALSARLDMTL